MSALSNLLASNTSLTAAETEHLQQLVAEWQLLSDMSFADLLLWVPISPDGTFLCAAQCRPTTGPTAYLYDRVGEKLPEDRAGALHVAMTESRILRESDPDWEDGVPIRREAIPIVFDSHTIAVLGRDSNLTSVRSPSPRSDSLLRTSFSDVTPKFLLSSSSSGVRMASSPSVEIPSRVMHLRARTERFRSRTASTVP